VTETPNITPSREDANRIQLAARLAATTPVLVMDTAALRERAATYIAYAPTLATFYAVKANDDPEVLRTLAEVGIGFEIASVPELDAVLAHGVSPQRIITSNPIKPPAFIEAVHQVGVHRFVVDSATEIEKLARYAPGCEVLLRLAVDNSGSAWPLDEKFAATAAEIVNLTLLASRAGLRPAGLTFHVGSQATDPDAWTNALRETVVVWEAAAASGFAFDTLNVGGGFPATHSAVDPDPRAALESILTAAAGFSSVTKLEVEPGRGMVADAGVLVTQVIGKASRSGTNWLYLDVGVFNGLMESVGGIDYRFTSLADSAGPELQWTVAGPSCDSMDVVAKQVALPDLAVGDRVAIQPAGAYTTVYASAFNGLRQPPVICVWSGQDG
jgi:ornithine decarboxylase